MKRIGIVGENYQNDACAFGLMMTPQYKSTVEFVPIVKKPITGTEKLGRLILAAIEDKKLDAVICIKDLDTYAELSERESWFNDLNKIIRKGIFYLVVMEFEALLLSDIDNLNTVLKTKFNYKGNPIKETNPKRLLTELSKGKYEENKCLNICQTISFQKIKQNHTGERSFNAFIKQFEKQFEL